jgi:hypothetical protein
MFNPTAAKEKTVARVINVMVKGSSARKAQMGIMIKMPNMMVLR